MKLAVVCLCILHLIAVGAGQSSGTDPCPGRSSVSARRAKAPQKQPPSSAGPVIQGKQRPLFARRGQYERKRIPAPKPKVVPSPPKDAPPSPKVAPKPVKPTCSQLTRSCSPLFGCCATNATCHCRFFNAICFCRRTTS
ncbi:uncharacterized protein AB9W97_004813 [Spinachia spinachia]